MPLYEYEDPDTGEIFEEFRCMDDRNKPFISPSGKKCKKIVSRCSGWVENREGWERDPSYYKKMKPKYVKDQQGNRHLYDPTKHC